jgi:hypothetical protein
MPPLLAPHHRAARLVAPQQQQQQQQHMQQLLPRAPPRPAPIIRSGGAPPLAQTTPPPPQHARRRAMLLGVTTATALALLPNPARAEAAAAADVTAAAAPPLPAAATTAAAAEWASAARLARVAEAIEKDFVDGQYYVTGHVTRSLYAPNAVFSDPTTRVVGADKYAAAVAALFGGNGRADLISIRPDGSDAVVLRWRLEGRLAVLGGLPIKPYTGVLLWRRAAGVFFRGPGDCCTRSHQLPTNNEKIPRRSTTLNTPKHPTPATKTKGTTRYTVGADGLVVAHEETWDVSAADAFISVFLPKFGAPPAPPIAELRKAEAAAAAGGVAQ